MVSVFKGSANFAELLGERMQFQTIASRKNERVQAFCRLRDTAAERKRTGLFVLEGLRLCADCAESGLMIESVFCTEAAKDKGGARLETLFSAAETVFLISDAVAEKLSDTVSTQGVFCVAKCPPRAAFTVRRGERWIALDHIQNPQNLGAASRTAEALGVTGLIVSGGCDRFNPKALRASMGSLLRLPVLETEDLAETLKTLGKTVPTYAAVPDATAVPLREADFSGGAVLVVGNEGNGVSDAVLRAVSARVTIPMRGRAESLNAAAAAAILMWEMMQ